MLWCVNQAYGQEKCGKKRPLMRPKLNSESAIDIEKDTLQLQTPDLVHRYRLFLVLEA